MIESWDNSWNQAAAYHNKVLSKSVGCSQNYRPLWLQVILRQLIFRGLNFGTYPCDFQQAPPANPFAAMSQQMLLGCRRKSVVIMEKKMETTGITGVILGIMENQRM